MKLSILTATYNREKYLKRLYESIINNQNYGLEAEWIIIDDGSIDRTKSLVEDFILENKLDIKYIYQKNSGKMSAINLGANMATGELLIDCDSDDFFSDNAFEIIYRNSDKLLSNSATMNNLLNSSSLPVIKVSTQEPKIREGVSILSNNLYRLLNPSLS